MKGEYSLAWEATYHLKGVLSSSKSTFKNTGSH